jgi:hypothetical protein
VVSRSATATPRAGEKVNSPMLRRRTVCAHPEGHSIDEAMVAGTPYRSVDNRFWLSESVSDGTNYHADGAGYLPVGRADPDIGSQLLVVRVGVHRRGEEKGATSPGCLLIRTATGSSRIKAKARRSLRRQGWRIRRCVTRLHHRCFRNRS